MDLGIAGKIALATASSAGLGRAAAEALCDEGVALVLNARGSDRLKETASQLRSRGADVVALAGDVTDPGEPARLVAETVARFGRLDILVANAGGPPAVGALDVEDDQVREAVESNLLSTVRLVRAALPHMRAGGWGRICCITSYSVLRPIPALALSNMARSGLYAWARTAANDLATEAPEITLNLVCPGTHATQRTIDLGRAVGGRTGDPADFGRVVAFLCSAHAAFVNGAAVAVDGGASA